MKMRTEELFKFMQARYNVLLGRRNGLQPPWTPDPILQRYRFCNVHREDDKVTQWIAVNWRKPHQKDPHLWFAMVVARLFNLPSTLGSIGYPVPYNAAYIRRHIAGLRRAEQKVFNSAYIVSTNGCKQDKVEYLLRRVLRPMWRRRDAVTTAIRKRGATLLDVHTALRQFRGLGAGFLAAQVVADLKYVAPLNKAKDWHTFAASGPGSRRGLNRVLGYDVASPWNERTWHLNLMTLKEAIDPLVARAGIPPVHAQDLQNMNCEWDKYERARLGEGRPKQLYPGTGQ